MSSPEHFMGLAIDLSRRRMRAEGCAPFAAVIVTGNACVVVVRDAALPAPKRSAATARTRTVACLLVTI